MQWSSETVATEVVTVTITPAATQRVVIGQIIGCMQLYTALAIPGTVIVVTPLVKAGGTYTFRFSARVHAATTSTSPTQEWCSADASNLDFCLVGAVGQAITVTMDMVVGVTIADGQNATLTVFGYLDGRAGGGDTTSEKI